MKEPVTIFKNTDDDWHGNYPNNQVKLQYIGKLTDGKFRVAVWGNDDFGIDKDFNKEQDAVTVFSELTLKDKINHKDLYDLGFANF